MNVNNIEKFKSSLQELNDCMYKTVFNQNDFHLNAIHCETQLNDYYCILRKFIRNDF